jgi:hypothetical protein
VNLGGNSLTDASVPALTLLQRRSFAPPAHPLYQVQIRCKSGANQV